MVLKQQQISWKFTMFILKEIEEEKETTISRTGDFLYKCAILILEKE